MQVKQLISFITAARTKNMAQTALALNYSHSTIYGHIEALEREFHTKLYLRTPHGIELTEQGREFLGYATRFMQLYDETMAAMSAVSQAHLRVGASEASDLCLMHNLLQEFIALYPAIELEYSKLTVDVALSRLSASTCDLAFLSECNYRPEHFYAAYLCTLPLVFVASSTYPFSQQAALPKLVSSNTLPVVRETLQTVGVDFDRQFSSLLVVGDLNTIRHLLLYNRGIAFLPLAYIRRDLEEGTLVRVPHLMQEIYLPTYIVTPSQSRIGPHTQALIDLAFQRYNPRRLPRDNIVQ